MNHSLEINLFLFYFVRLNANLPDILSLLLICPVKRQSTGQVATSEYHSRRASPEINKKKRVRYDIT